MNHRSLGVQPELSSVAKPSGAMISQFVIRRVTTAIISRYHCTGQGELNSSTLKRVLVTRREPDKVTRADRRRSNGAQGDY